jgi:hypothetical protein
MSLPGNLYGFALMTMKAQGVPAFLFVFEEDAMAFFMQDTFRHQFIHRATDFEAGIELDKRVGPEDPLI